MQSDDDIAILPNPCNVLFTLPKPLIEFDVLHLVGVDFFCLSFLLSLCMSLLF